MGASDRHETDFVRRAEAAITATIHRLGRTVDGRFERIREGGQERLVHCHVGWSGVEVWIDDWDGGDGTQISTGLKRRLNFERASGISSEEMIQRACDEVQKAIVREERKSGK